jgi:fatty acid desaturase
MPRIRRVSQRPEASSERGSPFAHPGVAWATLALLAAMWGLLVVNAIAFPGDPDVTSAAGVARIALHVALGVIALNLSFTIWHEAVHGLVFRSRAANDVVGILGAFPALIPWFTIRRGHLLHHAHTNDPERDPDQWFVRGSIWSLPLRYPAGIARTKRMVAASGQQSSERAADRAQLALALAAMVALAATGHVWLLVACWLLPKGIAMWIHAWYVNVLPHRDLPAERYKDTRTFPLPWLAPFFLMHQYHGLHHAWQTVPWNRYGEAFRAKRAFLEGRGAPIRGKLLER